VRSLNSRIERIERQLSDGLGTLRCPLCLDRQVWRSRLNGQRQLEEDDPVYDETWHCRRCGAAAPVVNMVLAGLPCDTHGP
jgi:hypothetical protein